MKKITLILLFLGIIPLGLPGIALGQSTPKSRYISLAPSTTEILFALGLDEEIVGVSSSCDYPARAALKPKIGSFSQPNIETILYLKPDYIFCTGLEQADTANKLKGLKLKVYVSDPANIEELFASIREIGKITDKIAAAEAVVKEMRDKINKVSAKVQLIPSAKKLKVFVEIWHSPLTTAGKGSFIDELIRLAGGINIAYDTKRPFSIFAPEEVIKRRPDCIILAYMDRQGPLKLIEKRLGWGEIPAVKYRRVYNDINPDLLLRPGPRLALGIEELFRRFYPERQ
jgi:iron complex transport system substrate-binding protein